MIDKFNQHLRKVIGSALRLDSIAFDPPDDNWRQYLTGLQKRAINIYLVELRENHGRRSNEPCKELRAGVVTQAPPPRWIDCHYLITAWDPASPDIAHDVEPTLAEHALLSAVAGLLTGLEAQPLTPRIVYQPDPLPAGFPEALADIGLSTTLPGEGFSKLAEFWGTMGNGYRWKPALYLVATVPVVADRLEDSFPVTTVVTRYRQAPSEEAESSITIGGRVLDSRHPLPGGIPAPVPDAEVQLQSPAGEHVQNDTSDDQGRFSFTGVPAGDYLIRAKAGEAGEKTLPVSVSAQSGGSKIFDLLF